MCVHEYISVSLPPLIPLTVPVSTPKGGVGGWVLQVALTFYGSPGGASLPHIAHHKPTGHAPYHTRAYIPWVSQARAAEALLVRTARERSYGPVSPGVAPRCLAPSTHPPNP